LTCVCKRYIKVNARHAHPWTRVELMLKWLLLAAALLFLCSIAGDVFFIHHHLDPAINNEHLVPYILALGSITVLSLSLQLGTSPACSGGIINRDDSVRHFRGWHNSAYLEVSLIAEYL
jgi:hypothetical protein